MIAIAFALEYESAAFLARHDPRLRVGVWILGQMGAAAAGTLRRRMEKQRPRLLVSAGFAGALQSNIRVGELILGTNFLDPVVAGRLRLGPAWHFGEIHTGSAIIHTAREKRRLGEDSGCLAGDLETRHIAGVCREFEVPLMSVRCISDAVDQDMPVPAKILLNPATGRPEPYQLFRFLLANPSSIGPFTRLLSDAKTAQVRLAKGLEDILPQLLAII